jgi:hypothetical protein
MGIAAGFLLPCDGNTPVIFFIGVQQSLWDDNEAENNLLTANN